MDDIEVHPSSERVPAPSATRPGGLLRNAVGLPAVLGQSLANVGPTIAILFTTALVVSKAGASAPFAIIFVMIGLGFTAWSVAVLTRYVPAAGVLYAAPARAFGATAGVGIALLLFLVYMLETAATALFSSGLISDFIASHTGVSVPWAVIFAALLAFYVLLAWFGIRDVLRFTLVFLAGELTVILTLVILIIVKGGVHGQVPGAFTPSFSPGGAQGIALAFVFGIFALGGFESSAGTIEESRRPRSFIPAAVLGAVLLGGLLFMISAYAMVIGYGTDHLAALAGSANPMAPLGTEFIGGWYGALLALALISATLGASLASATLAMRVVFSLGRDGIVPKALGRAHPRYHSPYISAVAVGVICYLAGLAFGLLWGVEGQYGITGYLTGISLGLAYFIFNLAMVVFMWRRHRDEFSWLRHGGIGLIGAVLVGVGLYPSFVPFPIAPDNYMVFVLIVWLIAAAGVSLLLRIKNPAQLERVLSIAAGAEQSGEATG